MEVWEIECDKLSLSLIYQIGRNKIDPERGLSLRFPRFIRLRTDKTVNESTLTSEVRKDFLKILLKIFRLLICIKDLLILETMVKRKMLKNNLYCCRCCIHKNFWNIRKVYDQNCVYTELKVTDTRKNEIC